MVVEELFA
jgi:hypothetical protein